MTTELSRKINIGLYATFLLVGVVSLFDISSTYKVNAGALGGPFKMSELAGNVAFPAIFFLYDAVVFFTLLKKLQVSRYLVFVGMASGILLLLLSVIFAELGFLSSFATLYVALVRVDPVFRIAAFVALICVYAGNLFCIAPKLKQLD